ncbi:fibroblast growth factor 23-like [Antennarius striatus]|uniref:fibroblast growth factor 23-like n=1 Tax=Antennarius striatus TaxID=241820 RepID=UPI0035B02B65
MQPALLSLMLIAVHVSLPVDCRMRIQKPEQLLVHQQSSISAPAEASSIWSSFHSDPSGLKTEDRYSLVIWPIRTNFVSLFDLRRRRFLCVDSKGTLYSSRQKDRKDCLFRRIWLDLANSRHVFYPLSGGWLLNLEGFEQQRTVRELPESLPALEERFLGPLLQRRRRNEEVNPSDPLRTESHPPHSAKDNEDVDPGQVEQDQTGAVSKETIGACDDPLRVLQPSAPDSPVKINIGNQD